MAEKKRHKRATKTASKTPRKVASKVAPSEVIKPVRTESFHSDEFFHHTKNELWYLGIALLLAAGFIGALSVGNYLFALVVVAAGLAIFRLTNLRPNKRRVEVKKNGIYWGDEFYGYHQIKAFYLAEHQGQTVVYFERLNLSPVLHFTVPDNQAEQVLDTLADYLPFHHHKDEPVGDKLGKWLKI